MIPEVTKIEQKLSAATSGAESAAKDAALAQVNKQESWLKRNATALIIGFVLGVLAGWIAHAVF